MIARVCCTHLTTRPDACGTSAMVIDSTAVLTNLAQLFFSTMKNVIPLLACCLTLPGLMTGCGSTQIKLNEAQLRDVLLEATENQIMDNLIRAHQNLPIVHFDYKHVTANVGTRVQGNVQGGKTRASTDTTQTTNNLTTTSSAGLNGLTRTASRVAAGTVGLVATASAVVTKPFSFSITPERNNTLSLEMAPVIEENSDMVYSAYTNFLKLKPRNNLLPLMEGPEPDEALVHLSRRKGRTWFWVPKAFAKDFFDVCIVTSARRTEPEVVTRIIANSIAGFGGGIIFPSTNPGEKDASAKLSIAFREAIPEDSGRVTLTYVGVFKELVLEPVSSQPFDPDRQTKRFFLIFPNERGLTRAEFEKEIATFQKELTGKSVEIRLDHWPVVGKTGDAIFVPTSPSRSLPSANKLMEDLESAARQLRIQSLDLFSR